MKQPLYPEKLQGKYVNLRIVKEDDAEFTLQLRLNPKKSQYFLNKIDNDVEKQRSWIKKVLEKEDEYRKVENLVRNSFWNVYRPGCLEHYVLDQLRNDSAFVPELDFVMLLNGEIIGQNMFMRAEITADDGRSIRVMTMDPICIKNELKRKGYGKILLDYSLQKVAELGCGRIRQAVSI